MFTGLIEATGTIESVQADGSASRVRIASALSSDLRAGDSIAVNGVCLTVLDEKRNGVGSSFRDLGTELPAQFSVDISPETLRVTTLGLLAPGRIVNLERPVRADARLGGHFVLGHVDGVGRIISLDRDGDCYWLAVDVPAELGRYVISKGSIAIDGISLTVARLERSTVGVQIIPFTWQHTALAGAKAGDGVNLEVDVLGKYVERLVLAQLAAAGR
jgi:riboflavin synthase